MLYRKALDENGGKDEKEALQKALLGKYKRAKSLNSIQLYEQAFKELGIKYKERGKRSANKRELEKQLKLQMKLASNSGETEAVRSEAEKEAKKTLMELEKYGKRKKRF